MIQLSPLAWVAGIGVIVSALAGAAGGWVARGVVADRDMAKAQALHAQERQRLSDAARQAEAKARETEQRRVEKIAEIEHEAQTRLRRVHDDAAAARRAADSLRKHIARLAARHQASGDPPVAALGPSTEDAHPLLADMLESVVHRAVALAEFADQAHAAGLACQRAYETVRKP